MPEADASLKLVFDNVRNYAICGALLAYAVWVWSQSAKAAGVGHWQASLGVIAIQLSANELRAASIAAFILTTLLALLNILQTWLLVFHRFLAPLPQRASQPASSQVSTRSPSTIKILVLLLTLPLLAYLVVQIFMGMLAAAAAFVAK